MSYSRWATVEEILSRTTQLSKDSEVKESGIQFMYDDNHMYIDDKEVHNLIVGTTGSGKTQATLLPQIRLAIKASESFVVNDVRGEIYNKLSGELAKQNYKTYVINLAEQNKGNYYNPFTLPYDLYKKGEVDKALDMIENIGYYLLSTNDPNTNEDPFWENSAISYFTGLVLYLFDNATKEQTNLLSVISLSNEIDKLTEEVNKMDKYSKVYTYLAPIVNAPTDTKGSIIAVFNQKIRFFTTRDALMQITSHNDIDLTTIREKTAIFIISENKSFTRSIIPLIIDQVNYAATLSNSTKKFNIYIDEFENLKAIKDFVNILSLARGNNIRYNIYVKSILELEYAYGKRELELVLMSFGTIIYLLANDSTTLERISKICGRLDENNDLITIEELKTLNPFDAIIITPRIYPIRTKLLPDFKIDWGFDETKIEQPNLEKKQVEVFKF